MKKIINMKPMLMIIVMLINVSACAYREVEDIEPEQEIEEQLQEQNSELDKEKQPEEAEKPSSAMLNKEAKEAELSSKQVLPSKATKAEPALAQEYATDSPETNAQEQTSTKGSNDTTNKRISGSDNLVKKPDLAKDKLLKKVSVEPQSKGIELKPKQELIGVPGLEEYNHLETDDKVNTTDTNYLHGSGNDELIIERHEQIIEKKPKRVWNLQRQL